MAREFHVRGVNVRSHKLRLGALPPRPIVVASHYGHWTEPAPYRSHRSECARLARRDAERQSNARLDRVRAEMYSAQDQVRSLRAAGLDYAAAAATAREKRREWLEITGQTPEGRVSADMGSRVDKIRAEQD